MRGLVKHEKRNMLIITLAFTIVVWFVLQGAIASDIAGAGNRYIYDNYGNLFLGTLNQYYESFIMILMIPISFVAIMQYRESSISKCGEFFNAAASKKRPDLSGQNDYRNDDIYDSVAVFFLWNDHDENSGRVMV